VGDRRGTGRRPVAAVPRLCDGRLPRAHSWSVPGGGCPACAEDRRAPAPGRGVRLLRAARRPPLARDEVRAGGDRDRLRRRPRALARAAADPRDRLTRARGLQRRAVRRVKRSALQRPHPVRHRGDDHARLFPRRLRGADLPAGGALRRPGLRAVALGARVRARLRGGLVALALAPRAPRPGRARGARHRADGRPLRRRARRATARRRLPGADDVRLLVPRAPPTGRAAAGRAAGGVGVAARAPGRRAAGGLHSGRLDLALRRRALGRRGARRRSA
jgi:hypothetical protein